MPKFNVVQKQRREIKQQRKRIIHGDPISAKLKIKPQPINISGKRKRKLFKKSLRDEKEALAKGLTMQDVEMAAAEGTSSREPAKFHMKKKLKLKQMKGKGKNKRKALKLVTKASVEAMAE